jgi:general secretion pathway protein G
MEASGDAAAVQHLAPVAARPSSTRRTVLFAGIMLASFGILLASVGRRLLSPPIDSKLGWTEATIRILREALDTMFLDLGRYPTTEEGLALLVTTPRDAALAARWHGPYIEGPVPLDPWKHPYHYSRPGKSPHPFALYSDRPDPSDGTMIGFPPPD